MFKVYERKSSLQRRHSRILQGGVSEVRGDKIGWWERRLLSAENIPVIEIVIDNTFHRRPDLVAYEYYSNTELDWIILQFNSIVDIQEEFVVGKTIKIPSNSYVYGSILNKSASGFFK